MYVTKITNSLKITMLRKVCTIRATITEFITTRIKISLVQQFIPAWSSRFLCANMYNLPHATPVGTGYQNVWWWTTIYTVWAKRQAFTIMSADRTFHDRFLSRTSLEPKDEPTTRQNLPNAKQNYTANKFCSLFCHISLGGWRACRDTKKSSCFQLGTSASRN